MEANAIPYETPISERITRLEVKVESTAKDVDQINERLDRAAKAAYFLGSSFLALAGVIIGSYLAN